MSDEKPKGEKVPIGHAQAEGTLSGVDDAQIYADIAETLLAQSTYPLIIARVERWPRDGHTIVIATADQSSDGTRARRALATQIAEWEAVEVESAT